MDTKDSHNRQFFNGLAATWDSLPGPSDANETAARFVERALEPGHSRILDVGCGTGILLPSLAARWVSRPVIIELDIALEMLLQNRRKFGGAVASCVCASALAPPFPDGCFDAVLCFGVLPHLGGCQDALGRLLHRVRPGGVIAVGHLMDSATLNSFHAGLDRPVNRDVLPPADALADVLRGLGVRTVHAEESPGWYFVRGEK